MPRCFCFCCCYCFCYCSSYLLRLRRARRAWDKASCVVRLVSAWRVRLVSAWRVRLVSAWWIAVSYWLAVTEMSLDSVKAAKGLEMHAG